MREFVPVSDLRSRDYGSPQCRLRLYILGVRADVQEPRNFQAMINYLKDFLPGVHSQTSVGQLVDWLAAEGDRHWNYVPMVCGIDRKDRSMLLWL